MSIGVIAASAVIGGGGGGGGGGYSNAVISDGAKGYWKLTEAALTTTQNCSNYVSGSWQENAVDGNPSTPWQVFGSAGHWWLTNLSTGVAVTSYAIRALDSPLARNMTSWTLDGYDGTWHTLDSRSGITWATGDIKVFTFSNTVAYTAYRVNVGGNGGDTYTAIAEITFLGAGINDYSGFNHHGAAVNSPTLGVSGALPSTPANKAMSFNGTNQFGVVGYDPWMALTTAFSVEAWVKTTATGTHSILDRDDNSSRVFIFRQNGASLEFIKISGGVVTASQACSLNDGNWHHVVATYDGSNIRLYNNGSLINTTAAAGTLAGTDRITIGANNSAGTNAYFSGSLDELAYYPGVVLSGSQIAAHYAAA